MLVLWKNCEVYAPTHLGLRDILIEGDKIAAIGENLSVPQDVEVIDVTGLNVYPGFVEAHGHIGLDGYGIGFEGADYNEMGDIVACHLRAIDDKR